MIRVAQVMGYMDGGGVEQVVMNYYRHIDRSHVQFDFLVCEGSGIVPREEIEGLGGRVFTVPGYKDLPRYMGTMERLFRGERWPIVHSHVNALSVFPLRAAKRAGVPVRIAHSHSTSGKGEHARNAAKTVLRRLSRVYPTDLASCGVYAGEWLFGKGAGFTVFPNAVELDTFAFDPSVRKEVRAELGIRDGVLAIGHLGRFVTQKNHAFLLRSFARVRELRPDAVLLLAGEGPLLEDARALAGSLGLGGFVRFLGRRGDACRLYQAFDAFALPSLYEGFCVVGVEAQAAGLPCLFSDAVSREVGLSPVARFLPLDERIWAAALADIGAGGHDRRMPEGVRAYGIEGAAARLLSYYEDLIAKESEG
ncbi:glycosyltransferase [Collinsella tanakaei]|nr:glycosyltransferase [Collinsella tanakaei]